MIVVDASVLTDMLVDDGPVGNWCRRTLAHDIHWAGPEHLLVETFSAIRGRRAGRKVTERRALDAIGRLAVARIDRIRTDLLLGRMWELRDNLTGYDAAYVAAAEYARCPLVTVDTRLARAPGLRCAVRTIDDR